MRTADKHEGGILFAILYFFTLYYIFFEILIIYSLFYKMLFAKKGLAGTLFAII